MRASGVALTLVTAVILTGSGLPAASAAKAPVVRVAAGNGSFTVRWDAARPSGVVGFRVSDRSRRVGKWTAWETRTVAPRRRSLVIGARNGSQHQVRVRTTTSTGPSRWSAPQSVRVGTPTAPTATATAASTLTERSVTARWSTARPNAAAVSAHRAELRRQFDDGTWSAPKVRILGPDARAAIWSGRLATNARYEVTVSARNRYGAGPPSRAAVWLPAITTPPPTPPPPPVAPTVPTGTPLPPPPPPSAPYKTAFRTVLATPSDVPAATSVDAVRNGITLALDWFAAQTGGRQPRFLRDASGGVAVATVTLPATQAELLAAPDLFRAVMFAVHGAHPMPATDVAVVFAEVRHGGTACGQGGWGVGAILWVANCPLYETVSTQFPYAGSGVIAHELVHVFGAAPPCAPHHDRGHINDDPRDILYYPPTERDWANVMLDPGRDDYYGTGAPEAYPTCTDIARSPLWE